MHAAVLRPVLMGKLAGVADECARRALGKDGLQPPADGSGERERRRLEEDARQRGWRPLQRLLHGHRSVLIVLLVRGSVPIGGVNQR